MADDTNTAEREAFIRWYMDYMPTGEMRAAHVWDNDHSVAKAWQARASLAASAGSEPWGAFCGGRVWVGKLPAHVPKMGLPIQWLYTHPSPPEGMAGWKLVPIEPTDEMLRAMDRACSDAMHIGVAVSPEVWAAGIEAAPPLPASEAKEL